MNCVHILHSSSIVILQNDCYHCKYIDSIHYALHVKNAWESIWEKDVEKYSIFSITL